MWPCGQTIDSESLAWYNTSVALVITVLAWIEGVKITVCFRIFFLFHEMFNSFFFFWIRGNLTLLESAPLLESVLCGSRWGSKTPAVPGSCKRCTPWFELETCCADLKPFTNTLHPSRSTKQVASILSSYQVVKL